MTTVFVKSSKSPFAAGLSETNLPKRARASSPDSPATVASFSPKVIERPVLECVEIDACDWFERKVRSWFLRARSGRVASMLERKV